MKKKIYTSLLDNKCKDILESLKKYISEEFPSLCDKSTDLQEISEDFHSFIYKISNNYIKLFELEFYNDKNLYPNIINTFEYLISNCIYDKLNNTFEETIIDIENLIKIKLEKFNLTNFDYNENKHLIDNEIEKFRFISYFKSPQDKLIIICNLCNFINNIYANFDRSKILKMLSFIIAQCKIKNLPTQIQYCFLFRNKTVINSDEDYYLSLVFQAIKILDKLKNKEQENNNNNNENLIIENEINLLYNNEELNIINLETEKLKKNVNEIKEGNNDNIKYQQIQNNIKILLDLIIKELTKV